MVSIKIQKSKIQKSKIQNTKIKNQKIQKSKIKNIQKSKNFIRRKRMKIIFSI